MRHDSIFEQPERLLYSSADVRIGTFACRPDHPQFETAGAIEGYTVFFPRTAVWIEHRGDRPFVADARIATIYNRADPYRRRPIAPDGDRGEWFSVGPELAVAIARAIDPSAADRPEQPFGARFAPTTPALYYRQRLLVADLARGALDDFAVEHEVTLLIGAVLAAASGGPGRGPRTPRRITRDGVEAARSEIARDPGRRIRLRELSAAVGLSPFHLCREFHRATGATLRQYRQDLQVRAALERIERPGAELSRLAHDLGFSSHSHFTLAIRQRLGAPPSRIRARLGSPRAATG